jgi:hypothetical protein
MNEVEKVYAEWLRSKDQAANMDTFETIADYYERALWGDTTPGATKYQYGKKFAVDFRDKFAQRRINPYFDVPFTITISYGDNAAAFAARQNGSYESVLENKKYGPGQTFLPIEETVKTINGVHLMSVSQGQDMSGANVQEVYQFMAQDLDNFDDIINGPASKK